MGTQSWLAESAGVLSGENLLTFTKLKGMFDPEAILVPTHIQVREERTIR